MTWMRLCWLLATILVLSSNPLFIPSAHACQDPESPPSENDPWDVNAPPGPSREISIDTDEGTWLSLDLSPDGQVIVFDLLGDLYSLPITGGDAVPLSEGIAWDMQPCFSPDGQRIAFTSDEGGGDNLWVMDRDGTNRRQVTKESFRLLNSPAWSPDGEYLAARKHFTSRRSLGAGEIWLYHQSGGAGLPMTTRPTEQKDVGEPAFSPDGRFLYYSLDSTPGGTFEYSKDVNQGIYRIDRLDRESGEVTTLVSGPGGACRPTPSPDGKKLAFVRRVRFATTLFVMDLESGLATPVFDGLERDMQATWAIHGVYPAMEWTPESNALVLWAQGKLWKVPTTGAEATQIPFRVKSRRTVQDAVRFPVEVSPEEFDVKVLRWVTVSPDCSRVVYQALGHLYVKELPEGQPRRLTTQDEHFEFHPSFSRDGRWIVYTTWNDETLAAVRVTSAEGSGKSRVLVPGPGHFANPVFTPDGTEVVYEKIRGGHLTSPLWSFDPGIYRVPADGGESVKITDIGRSPQFGADGKRVYLTRRDGGGNDPDRLTLFSLPLEGGEPRDHLRSDWGTEFTLSPDGQWVAFAERFNAYVAPWVETGRVVTLGPKTLAMPVFQASRDAGENLRFSGDSTHLHWSLGPDLFLLELSEALASLEGNDEGTLEPKAEGHPISFRAPTHKAQGKVALTGARVITMRGDEVIEDGCVVIDGERIVAVGSTQDVSAPSDAQVIDVRGKTIMPGIVDVHYHGAQTAGGGVTPQNNWYHAATLAYGITAIHDPSHDTNSIHAVSEMARAGRVLAPRTYSTGTILYGAAGNFKAEIDSLDDARSHLRRMKAVGAISVKSYNQPRRDQRQQVIQAARELEIMVVPEGGSTLQHNLTMVVDGHTGVEHSLPVENIYADIEQLWGPTDVGYTPTLMVGYGGIWGEHYWYHHRRVWENEKLLRFVPKSIVDPRSRRRTMAPEEEYNTKRSSRICGDLVKAGARTQVGAHGQLAGLGTHWELWMIAEGGLTPLQAIRAATLDGAFYVGLHGDLGSLEPGKLADLIVLDENPLEDIRHTETIRSVMLGGELYDAETLAPADGRAGQAPRFYFEGREYNFPTHSTGHAGCMGCTVTEG